MTAIADNPVTVQRVAVITNPVSCPEGVECFEDDIRDELDRLGVASTFYRTCESETALPLAKQAISEGVQKVIAAGGDGTIMEAMNALIGTDIALGVIPLGTGNLLAVNLGIPLDLTKAVDVAVNGTSRKIDVVDVDDGKKYFAIMGGIGFDAHIMEKTDRVSKQRFGRLAYVFTGLKYLSGRRFHATMSLDGKPPIAVHAKMILIGNLAQVAPGLKLFPATAPDDGVIEVGVLRAKSLLEFVRLGFRTILGRSHEDPAFDAYQATTVTIKLRHHQPIEFDGDAKGKVVSVSLKVLRNAVNILLPKSSD